MMSFIITMKLINEFRSYHKKKILQYIKIIEIIQSFYKQK